MVTRFVATTTFIFAVCSLSLGTKSERSSIFLYPPDYVKEEIPRSNQSDVKAHVVKVNIEIWAINDLCLSRQVLEVDFTLTIVWSDSRLTVNPNASSQSSWPILSKQEIRQIWTPTLLLRNCKGCQPITLSNGYDLYVNKKDGRVSGQLRRLEAFTCSINLRAFPMDVQFCQLQIYTYEDTEDTLQLQHRYPNTDVVIHSNVSLAEYDIGPIKKTECVVIDAEGDVYSCIDLRIRLDHWLNFHITTLYCPTSFIVVLSWISFWLPLDLAPARIALGLTSILTLATRLDQAQKNLPPVAYVKAIDVWMFACIFLVSMSLFEFAISHYKWENEKSTSLACNVKVYPIGTKTRAFLSSGTLRLPSEDQHKSNNHTQLDKISRFLFPSTFLIFNIAYWSYYISYYN